jgi:uncharacterized protein (DUF362 family)
VKRQNEFAEQMSEALAIIGLDKDFDGAKAIFIKPNLTYPKFKEGVTTRVEFVDALVCALRGINDHTKIYVGEGEGGYNSFSMTEALRTMGFFELEETYQNVQVVNLSKLPTIDLELQAHGKPYVLELPELFFKDIDFSITCSLPKVHCMTNVTLSFKNQWGCLPDTMRLKNHFVFDEIIGQVCEKLKFRYAFLDGKYGLDNNGPMVGDPVEVNWFVASNSLGAFDVVVSEMMGINWREVGHLRAAAQRGLIPEKKDVEVIGDIDSLKRKFSLKRSFWNYPALVAFHSSRFTHLVYFSKWAKLIHDIMYTFRKRPIE